MKRLLALASALVIALPLYAQTGATDNSVPSDSTQFGTESTAPMGDEMQEEEAAPIESTPSSDVQMEEEGSSTHMGTEKDSQQEEENPESLPSDTSTEAEGSSTVE